ncbi:MAG TPA: hypothetical protein VN641_05915 [Urbifossiella sp.]|nr:hypothetical protein [Urbifossiella sp.]
MTSPRFVLAFLPALAIAAVGFSDDKKPDPKSALKGQAAEDVVRLKREVDALETIYHLEATTAQLNGLLALAQKTAAKPAAAKTASASADYRKMLQELRAALVKNDEAKAPTLFQKLSELEESDPTEIEDEFDLTDAAIKAAPQALKLVTAAQIVSYLAAMENEVPDPVERVAATLIEGEELPADEWKSLRDETASEIAWLMHGFNSPAEKGTVKSVTALLDRGHAFKGENLAKELPGLEAAAKKLVGGVGPIVVLQHYMERELAEFLSNPRAVVALKARIEQLKRE